MGRDRPCRTGADSSGAAAHRLPLCGRAVQVLREAERVRGAWNEAGDEELVFPTVCSKALDAAAISKLVRGLGRGAQGG